MVNDCLSKIQQESFINGLAAMDSYSRKIYKKEPNSLTGEEWEHLIFKILKIKGDEKIVKGLESNTIKDAKYFINTSKQFSIQGFTTSKYYMTEIMPYSMFPGKFHGKVLIKEGEKANIYG